MRSFRKSAKYAIVALGVAGLANYAMHTRLQAGAQLAPSVLADVKQAPLPDGDVASLRQRGLIIPVAGTTAVELTDTFTQARALGRTHDAIDILAPRGTPVRAVEDGRVTKLFVSKPGGITIYQFDVGSQYAYYYAHLDRYADGLHEKQLLHKGDVIGYVGSTGNASVNAPHLHFAIFRLGPDRQWWKGAPLNPFLVWREAQRQGF